MSGQFTSRHVSPTCAIVAGLLSVFSFQQAFAEESTQEGTDATARATWREAMSHNSESGPGCFQAAYPSYVWERTECKVVHPKLRRAPQKPTPDQPLVTGNGNDYVIQGTGLISATVGSFPTVSNVTSETSVGVAAYGGAGILGANEYTLQINTNGNGITAACAGHSGCTVWQQFVYATDSATVGGEEEAAVYIQYWLNGWGSSACPSGWTRSGAGDCYTDSNATVAPNVAPTTASLAKMSLWGGAVAGGNDTVVFNNGTAAYSVTASDSVLDIAQVWYQSEFNIFGDGGGSRADFNIGATITVEVTVIDGSTATPSCVANSGTTGETNNLNLGTCTASGGYAPSIEFIESDHPSGDFNMLMPGEGLGPEWAIEGADGSFLMMQADGNLVFYSATGSQLWSAGTSGIGNALQMQTDGNLVIYNIYGAALWATNTPGTSTYNFLEITNDDTLALLNSTGSLLWSSTWGATLPMGQRLSAGQQLISQDSHTYLAMQTDGNLVLYWIGNALWSTNTVGTGNANYLIMQTDGNLVLYNAAGTPLWATNTWGTGTGNFLTVQNDSNLVLYNAAGTPLWATNTCCR